MSALRLMRLGERSRASRLRLLRPIQNAAQGLDLVEVQTYRDPRFGRLVRQLLGVGANEDGGDRGDKVREDPDGLEHEGEAKTRPPTVTGHSALPTVVTRAADHHRASPKPAIGASGAPASRA